MASRERAFTVTNGVISYGAELSAYGYRYDECNNLTKLTCSVLGSTWSTVYTYDADNRASTTTLQSGKVIENTFDPLGRVQKRTIKQGNTTIHETTIGYLDVSSSKTTALVSTYQNGSDAAYAYEYDAVGNIVSITQGNTSISYVYDAANRLIREDNGVTNQTIVYDYTDDLWGNIQNKKIYAYTTADDLTALTYTPVPYAYTNADWGDQLIEYNGQTITYDEMGNPTTYRGYTFGWRGKQLTSASNGTNTLTFEYNEDGLRQKKVCNNVVTDYFYNGSVLIGMQRGTAKLLFSYDAGGNVISVRYITANDTNEYYYLRNAQGDIVKLIDANGTPVVEYTYDTWGKKVTTTGSLAGTLGLFQPFRYRGYVYDWETGFYYLQSRYYDPTTGRFISADVLLSTGQGVLGHNAYAYCLGNPVGMVDDGGTAPDHNISLTDGGKQHYKDCFYLPQKYFDSEEEAAIYFAKTANYITMSTNKEVCSFMYKRSINGKDQYFLSGFSTGEHDNVIDNYARHFMMPGTCAFLHTHPFCTGHCGGYSAAFSWGDCLSALSTGVCYMSDTGSGYLFRIDALNAFSGIIDGIDVFTSCELNREGDIIGFALDSRVTLVNIGLPKTYNRYICK